MEHSSQHFRILLLFTIPSMFSGNVLPKTSKVMKLCPKPMGGWSAPCTKECETDSDCAYNKKCCTLSTCATFCAEPLLIDENGLVTTSTTAIPPLTSPVLIEKTVAKDTSVGNIRDQQPPSSPVLTKKPAVKDTVREITRNQQQPTSTVFIEKPVVKDSTRENINSRLQTVSPVLNEKPVVKDTLRENVRNQQPLRSSVFIENPIVKGTARSININNIPSSMSPVLIENPVVKDTSTGTTNNRKSVETSSLTHFSSVSRSTNNRNVGAQNVLRNSCIDECLRHLQCEAGYMCMKIGCRHICVEMDTTWHFKSETSTDDHRPSLRNVISANIAAINRNNNYVNTAISRNNNILNNVAINRNNIRSHRPMSRLCKRECITDADCTFGSCTNIDCNMVCRGRLSNRYI